MAIFLHKNTNIHINSLSRRTLFNLYGKATPSGIPVSGQGFPQGRMRAGGFCHYCIMHTDSCYTLNHKVYTSHNSTVRPYGHALYKHCNNGIISAFLKWVRAVYQKPYYHLDWPNSNDSIEIHLQYVHSLYP